MENVTVEKGQLLEALEANREAHRTMFDEALRGYTTEAERLLMEHLERVRSGKRYGVNIVLPVPVDHTKDYDRAIKMIEMDVRDTVALAEHDFQSYVMGDWSWRRSFLSSTAGYSATAARALEAE